MDTIDKKTAAALLEIAKDCFFVEDLKIRNSGEDFISEVSVWGIKEALERAYLLGRKSK